MSQSIAEFRCGPGRQPQRRGGGAGPEREPLQGHASRQVPAGPVEQLADRRVDGPDRAGRGSDQQQHDRLWFAARPGHAGGADPANPQIDHGHVSEANRLTGDGLDGDIAEIVWRRGRPVRGDQRPQGGEHLSGAQVEGRQFVGVDGHSRPDFRGPGRCNVDNQRDGGKPRPDAFGRRGQGDDVGA